MRAQKKQVIVLKEATEELHSGKRRNLKAHLPYIYGVALTTQCRKKMSIENKESHPHYKLHCSSATHWGGDGNEKLNSLSTSSTQLSNCTYFETEKEDPTDNWQLRDTPASVFLHKAAYAYSYGLSNMIHLYTPQLAQKAIARNHPRPEH